MARAVGGTRPVLDKEARVRRSLFCLTAAAIAAMAVSCAQRGPSKTVITFAAGNDPSGATAALIEEYNAAHPDVEVRFQAMPANTDQQHDSYVTYLSAGETGIDLYSLDVIWTSEFARAGWIKPLPEGFVDPTEFLGGPLGSATYEGRLYAVPWFTDAGVLYYRMDLLDAAGVAVPQTWDEFRAACRAAAPGKTDGFVWQGARYEGLVCNFLEFLWGAGGSIEPDRLAADPAAVRREVETAIRLMKGFIDEGASPASVLTYKEEDSRRVFTEGQSVFLRNWPYAWSMAEGAESKVKGKVGIAPLPHAPGCVSYSTIGGWNVALSSHSRNPEKALDFLRFITSEHALALRAIKGAYLPTRTATYRDPEVLAANPHFASFFEVFTNTRNRPQSPEYPRASDAIQENVHKALSGEVDPRAAANAIVEELAAILVN
jgi:multiple sugar transport system substrate-binding protein